LIYKGFLCGLRINHQPHAQFVGALGKLAQGLVLPLVTFPPILIAEKFCSKWNSPFGPANPSALGAMKSYAVSG
jgi:hypothetical protein